MSCRYHQKQTYLPSLGSVVFSSLGINTTNSNLSLPDYLKGWKHYGGFESLKVHLYHWLQKLPSELVWRELCQGKLVSELTTAEKMNNQKEFENVAGLFLFFGTKTVPLAKNMVLNSADENSRKMGLAILNKIAPTPLDFLKQLNQLWEQTNNSKDSELLLQQIVDCLCGLDDPQLLKDPSFEDIYQNTCRLAQKNGHLLNLLEAIPHDRLAWQPHLVAPLMTWKQILSLVEKKPLLINDLLLYLPAKEFEQICPTNQPINNSLLWQKTTEYLKKKSGQTLAKDITRWRATFNLIKTLRYSNSLTLPQLAEIVAQGVAPTKVNDWLCPTAKQIGRCLKNTQKKELLDYYSQPDNAHLCSAELATTLLTDFELPSSPESLKNSLTNFFRQCRQKAAVGDFCQHLELQIAQKYFEQQCPATGRQFLGQAIDHAWQDFLPARDVLADNLFEKLIWQLKKQPPNFTQPVAQQALRESYQKFLDFAQKDFKPKHSQDKRLMKQQVFFWQLALAAQDEVLIQEIWRRISDRDLKEFKFSECKYWFPTTRQKGSLNLMKFILAETEKTEAHNKTLSNRNAFLQNFEATGLSELQKKEINDFLWQNFKPKYSTGDNVLSVLFSLGVDDSRNQKLAQQVMENNNDDAYRWQVAQKQMAALDYLTARKKESLNQILNERKQK